MNQSPDLLYTDVEESLRESVRDLLTDRCPSERVLALSDGDRSGVRPLWRAVAGDLGLAGLLVPEEAGGAGASAREAAVVLEELGRSVAPVPFLTSAVVATGALLAAGGESPARADLLAALASGDRTAALVLPLATGPDDAVVAPGAVRDSGGPAGPGQGAPGRGSLTGSVTSVAGALEADVLLVPVAGDGVVALHAVDTPDTGAEGVHVEPVTSLDMSRQLADLTLSDAPSTEVVEAAHGETAVRSALRLGAGLLASEQLGLAQWCLDTTVAYLKQRRQFGRVVGGFQALKHRLADLYVSVESARAAARYAAATAAAGDADSAVAAAVAQSFCAQVAVTAAEECVQLHGGIGMTWEHPAHLYLKRAKADQVAFGSPGAHRRALAELVDVPV